MPDPESSFSKQFVPFEDGYLYYPGRKSGGKFVSEDEYAQLLAQWEAVAGRKGLWKTSFVIMGCVLVALAVLAIFDGPDWLRTVFTYLAVAALVARYFWFAMAPRRLVNGRPDAAPPRSAAANKRAARSMISWTTIIWAFIVCAALFVAGLSAHPKSLAVWIWIAGSGAMGALYIWVAIMKYRDRTI